MRNRILILIMFLLPCIATAEDPYFRAKKGDQALLFSFKGLDLLTAGNFDGGLGYQVYFANHWAFRFGMGMNYDKKTVKMPSGLTKDSVSSEFSFDLMPAIRYNLAASNNIEIYTGLFALIGLHNSKTEGVDFSTIDITKNELNIGGGLILGAEWFAWKNVSLSAEYQLLYKSTSGKEKVTSGSNEQETDIPSTVNFYLGASQANFTISFYF